MTHGSSVTGPSPQSEGRRTPEEDAGPRGLPRPLFVGILVIVVALFLLARGPIWRSAYSAELFDSAIFWSYLPIPLLVAIGLFIARRFSWRFFFLESLAIAVLKYGLTFGIAILLWATKGPPPRPPATPPPPKPPVVEAPLPPPTPIAKERTGAVRGAVRSASGGAVAGALVYVAAGLESFVFERPTEPLHLENDGKVVRAKDTPSAAAWPDGLIVVRAGQTILGRSLDGHLHTLVAQGGATGTTFNIPMMSSGVWSTVVVREPAKVSRLRCTVHPEGEATAHLAVLDHPYFTASSADGAFRIEGIPEGRVTIATFSPSLGETTSELTITAGAEAALDLRLP